MTDTKDKLLITGVTGYIGFVTLLLALSRGYPIRAIVRSPSQITSLQAKYLAIANALKSSQLEFTVLPDFLEPNAVYNALQGVNVIIHLASPLAIQTEEYERDIISPAISMVTVFLEAAARTPSVRRVVITSSCVTLIPFEWNINPDCERVYTANDINPTQTTTPPPKSPMEAYWLSKALARRTTKTFMNTNKPSFDFIHLLPGVVIGADSRLIPSSGIINPASAVLEGTRGAVLSPVLGEEFRSGFPFVNVPVHVNDVARAHVDAINPRIPGNTEYILASTTSPQGEEGGIEWDRDVRGVAKRYFSEAVENGDLPCKGSLGTVRWRLDVSETERVFGWEMTGFEEMVRGLLGQYLESRGLEGLKK